MRKTGFASLAMGGLVALAIAFPATAAVKTKTVDYKIGNDTFEGFLAYDDATTAKRPGVVIYHAWTGIGDNERQHAEMLAKLGYVAFVADVYGKGIHPTAPKESGAEMGKYMKDRPLLRQRANAGLAELLKNPMVDKDRVAAMGYCFGGAGALELARSGAPVKAIVTFHGSLSSPTPDDAKNIKGHVLVLHGGDDPAVPLTEVTSFENEMRNAKVDWEVVLYANTVHAFTDKHAGNDNSKGAAYNAEADKRSWIAMKDFFHEYLTR
jgi:dienelactone hydrolase